MRGVLQLRSAAPRSRGHARPSELTSMTVDDGRRCSRVRHRIRVRGVVQGVGFRPFVHRLATRAGSRRARRQRRRRRVRRGGGRRGRVSATFERRLVVEAPPLARIDASRRRPIDAVGERDFRIVESSDGAAGRTFVPPDVAVCDDCLRELFDPGRSPLPLSVHQLHQLRSSFHDHRAASRTTAPTRRCGDFRLCRDVRRRSITTPSTAGSTPNRSRARRAGRGCGSKRRRRRVDGTDAAIAATQRALADGAIVAIKGLAATTSRATRRRPMPSATLRRRKGRADKPFAVMVRDLAAAERLAEHRDGEAAPARPARSGRSCCCPAARRSRSRRSSRRATRSSACSCRTRLSTTCCSVPCPVATHPYPMCS